MKPSRQAESRSGSRTSGEGSALAPLPAFVLVVVLLATVLAAGSGGANPPTLTLTYTASGTLTVAASGGATLTAGSTGVVASGTYQVVITDDAPDGSDPVHMFELSGPGVDLLTDLQGGDDRSEVYNESLAANGTYTFKDDDQPSIPGVVFRTSASAPVATVPTPTLPTATQTVTTPKTPNSSIVAGKAVVFRGTLHATVRADGAVALQFGGARVTSLKAGRYRISVTDASRKGGFMLQESRLPAHVVSGVSFVGRRTAELVLATGQWFFYSTFTGRKTYFLVEA